MAENKRNSLGRCSFHICKISIKIIKIKNTLASKSEKSPGSREYLFLLIIFSWHLASLLCFISLSIHLNCSQRPRTRLYSSSLCLSRSPLVFSLQEMRFGLIGLFPPVPVLTFGCCDCLTHSSPLLPLTQAQLYAALPFPLTRALTHRAKQAHGNTTIIMFLSGQWGKYWHLEKHLAHSDSA